MVTLTRSKTFTVGKVTFMEGDLHSFKLPLQLKCLLLHSESCHTGQPKERVVEIFLTTRWPPWAVAFYSDVLCKHCHIPSLPRRRTRI